MLKRSIGFSLLLTLCVCSPCPAQTGEAPAAQTPPQSTTISEPRLLDFAGFSIPWLGDGFELNCTEISTGTMYTVDVSRSFPGDPHRVADTTQFARFSQSIRPLAQVGTLEQLQAAALADAQNMARQLEGNTELGDATACTRDILGQARTGQRFGAVLSHDAEQDPEPISGHIEVYAFEHQDKGVVVILKASKSNRTAQTDDEAHIKTMLHWLVFNPIAQTTPYTYRLGGIPVQLPVGSRIVSVEQPNEISLTALVKLDGGELSLYAVNVPEQYSLNETFSDLTTNYTQQMQNQIEQSGGQARLLWSSETAIPGPVGSEQPAEASVMLIEIPNGQIYSMFYKDMYGRIAVTGTFNMDASNPSHAHEMAELFVSGFRGGNPNSTTKNYELGAHSITLSDAYWVTPIHDDAGDIEMMVFTLSGSASPEWVLHNTRKHHSYTVMQTLDPTDTRDLDTLNAQLLERLVYLGSEATKAYDPSPLVLPAPSEIKIRSADGNLASYLGRAASPKPTSQQDSADTPEPEENIMIVHSRMLQSSPDGPRVHLASVSNPLMNEDSIAITEHLASLLVPMDNPGLREMDFGVLHYDPRRVFPSTTHRDWNREDQTWFTLNGDRVEITTSHGDEKFDVLSSRLLVDSFLKLKWRSIALTGEQAAYPANSEGLTETEVAGHPALMFQAHLPGQNELAAASRSSSVRVRIYGFVHADRYTTVAITQHDNFDDARFDTIIDMLQPKK